MPIIPGLTDIISPGKAAGDESLASELSVGFLTESSEPLDRDDASAFDDRPEGCKSYSIAATVCKLGLFAAGTAATAAASGVIGASLLDKFYDGYNIPQSAAAGAVGGLFVAAPIWAVLFCCAQLSESSNGNTRILPYFLLNAAIAALSSRLGSTILYDSGSYDSEMNGNQFLASAALGSVILHAGLASTRICIR